MERRAVYQTFAWFYDLHKRELLDLEPPYQRRSVWNDRFRTFFVDTVLNNFPCPAIFIYEEISPDGVARYKVVDGKQRLTTLIDFVENRIAVPPDSKIERLREKTFSEFEDADKRIVWRYQFAVEHIPQENESIIQDIFDRINRNVSKLTPQELRHARFQGAFITVVEEATEWLSETMPKGIPNIAAQSKRQMKDVEFVATLFLFLEQGEQSTGQADLDRAFSERDEIWDDKTKSYNEFRRAMEVIEKLFEGEVGTTLATTRIRNQADFYSLYAAVVELSRQRRRIDPAKSALQLLAFLQTVDDETERNKTASSHAADYYAAARSASTDPTPRRTRIEIIKAFLV